MVKTMSRQRASKSLRPALLGLAVAIVSTALLLADAPPILADPDEVILTIQIQDSGTGVSGGGVSAVSLSLETQFLLHGQHITVEEGESITLTFLPDSDFTFEGWDGDFATERAEFTASFYADTTLTARGFSTSDPETSDEDGATASASGGERYPDSAATEENFEDAPEPQQEVATRALTEIWVDFQHVGIEDGTQTNPFDSTAEGVSAIEATTADTIKFQPGASQETPTIDAVVTLKAPNGLARIGVDAFAVSYTLMTSAVGTGSVTGGGGYVEGATATLNASFGGGWEFSHWTGDLTGTSRPDSLLMDSDKSVTAIFVEDPAHLEVSNVQLNAGGSLPSQAKAGDVLTIDFDVDNIGSNTADSADNDWTDNIFLSRDATFDSTDKTLGGSGDTIAEAEMYTATVSITIPDVSPGDYYLIMRPDVDDEVTHTAADRDAGIATHALTIVDSELSQ